MSGMARPSPMVGAPGRMGGRRPAPRLLGDVVGFVGPRSPRAEFCTAVTARASRKHRTREASEHGTVGRGRGGFAARARGGQDGAAPSTQRTGVMHAEPARIAADGVVGFPGMGTPPVDRLGVLPDGWFETTYGVIRLDPDGDWSWICEEAAGSWGTGGPPSPSAGCGSRALKEQ